MAALLARKKKEEGPPLLPAEARIVASLNGQAYQWLGARHAYYQKIRTAKEGGLADIFKGKSLEEEMEATRSALTLVTRTLNAGLVTAYNSTVDMVSNVGEPPEFWPDKVDMPDRNKPPTLSINQDALIIGWMPLKFLNLAKLVRDKGKGLDFYAEGVVKKLYFKVIGYYTDPGMWKADRLGINLLSLPEDAELLDVNNKLSVLKSELEMFANSYQMFKFGRAPRTGADASTRNAVEDAMDVPDSDFVHDLYFQNFIINGMENFIFRYMLFLLSCSPHPKAYRPICQIFEPALAKVTEIRTQFQGSFMLEREKTRLRGPFQEYSKKVMAQPLVQKVEEKGQVVRKINYSTKLLDVTAFAHHPNLTDRQKQIWGDYLKKTVLEQENPEWGYELLGEVLHSLVHIANSEFGGNLKVVEALREFAEAQEKLGQAQVRQHKKKVDIAKQKKMKQSRKFKVLEQFDMAKTVEEEALAEEAEGIAAVEAMEQSIAKRRDAYLARAQQMEEEAKARGHKNAAVSAQAVYEVALELDSSGKIATDFVNHLLLNINKSADLSNPDLYRNLFKIIPSLFPTQKIMLRRALEGKLELAEDELQVTEEDERAYTDQIISRKTELTTEVPGIMEQKLMHGAVNATVDKLLGLGITNPSLLLLLQMPLAAPNKPSTKLPGPVAQKLVQLNLLMNPFADVDLILPNVEESAPPTKRLNFHRLSKAL